MLRGVAIQAECGPPSLFVVDEPAVPGTKAIWGTPSRGQQRQFLSYEVLASEREMDSINVVGVDLFSKAIANLHIDAMTGFNS